ncbi:unnamed protein product [Prorocentrum cordatum]|uniref:Uncharacterized protein n=1 Tax=Prorocentrum cordatum TaxID=2364126 RepID=A0ABN9VB52_9DINO|nr:unnamed protein product [Polarella glacialis]
MRNRGPGRWKDREWRWGNVILPLHLPDPKEVPPPEQKPLGEVALLCINQMAAKNSLPKLSESIAELQKEGQLADSDAGCVTEQRFREVLKDALTQVCTPEDRRSPDPCARGAARSELFSHGFSRLEVLFCLVLFRPVLFRPVLFRRSCSAGPVPPGAYRAGTEATHLPVTRCPRGVEAARAEAPAAPPPGGPPEDELPPKRLRLLRRTTDEAQDIAERERNPLEDILGVQGAREYLEATKDLKRPGMVGAQPEPDDPQRELLRVWELKMKELVARGTGQEDFVVVQVMERARRGLPWGRGLPVLSLEEANALLLRCGAGDALAREDDRRMAVQVMPNTASVLEAALGKPPAPPLPPQKRAAAAAGSKVAAAPPAPALSLKGPLTASLMGEDDEVPFAELARRQQRGAK